MTKTGHLFACLTVALASWLSAGSAYAQNSHSWVSAATGSGTACTRDAPCLNLFTALNNNCRRRAGHRSPLMFVVQGLIHSLTGVSL
jgi:hypothetical protein